jgi:hypothetical protein
VEGLCGWVGGYSHVVKFEKVVRSERANNAHYCCCFCLCKLRAGERELRFVIKADNDDDCDPMMMMADDEDQSISRVCGNSAPARAENVGWITHGCYCASIHSFITRR